MNRIRDFYTNNFDLLRLLAAFLVLFTHCYELLGKLNLEPLYNITSGKLRFSTIGLYVFFFTSGFLVAQSFFKSFGIRSFLWKRFLRIYPALIVMVLVTVFIIGPLFTNEKAETYFLNPLTHQYLFTATGIFIQYFLPGVFTDVSHFDHGVNGSLWSIGLEIKLYFFLIIFATISKKIKYTGRLFPLLFSIFLCYAVGRHYNNFQYYFNELHCRLMLIFFLGYACQAVYDKIKLEWYIMSAFFMFYTISMTFLPQMRFIMEPFFFGYLTLFMAYKVKQTKLKMDISYGLYIYAFLVTQILIQVFNFSNPIVILIFLLLAVVPISMLSWYFIEKKALSFKNRI